MRVLGPITKCNLSCASRICNRRAGGAGGHLSVCVRATCSDVPRHTKPRWTARRASSSRACPNTATTSGCAPTLRRSAMTLPTCASCAPGRASLVALASLASETPRQLRLRARRRSARTLIHRALVSNLQNVWATRSSRGHGVATPRAHPPTCAATPRSPHPQRRTLVARRRRSAASWTTRLRRVCTRTRSSPSFSSSWRPRASRSSSGATI